MTSLTRSTATSTVGPGPENDRKFPTFSPKSTTSRPELPILSQIAPMVEIPRNPAVSLDSASPPGLPHSSRNGHLPTLALYWAVSTGMWDAATNPTPDEKKAQTVNPRNSPEENSPGSPEASAAS